MERDILDDVYGIMWDWRRAHKGARPKVLHIGYRWHIPLVNAYNRYVANGGILPVMDALTVFGMQIEQEFSMGPWAWATAE